MIASCFAVHTQKKKKPNKVVGGATIVTGHTLQDVVNLMKSVFFACVQQHKKQS